jgi:LacI family transcriptional regulator
VGLLVDDDWTALEAVEGCMDAGLAVPDQVAVIGIGNNQAVCENARIPLSSVDVGYDWLGHEAARFLDRLMRGRSAPRGPVRIAPRGVVVRQSSDILSAEHPEVAKAVRYIWDHHREHLLSVPRIVSATGLSKTSLNLAFRRCLGRTVGRLLLEMRLRRAQELLTETDDKVRRIAAESGFRDANYLRAVLRRETGMGPRAWRKKYRWDTRQTPGAAERRGRPPAGTDDHPHPP